MQSAGLLCADLLDHAIARYDAADVPDAEKLPQRRYVAHGPVGAVAADGLPKPVGSLMVWSPRATVGGAQLVKVTAANQLSTVRAAIALRLLRPIATFNRQGTPPSADTLTEESLLLYRDEARLIEAWKAWFEHVAPHLEVQNPDADPIRSGELGGWRLSGSIGPL